MKPKPQPRDTFDTDRKCKVRVCMSPVRERSVGVCPRYPTIRDPERALGARHRAHEINTFRITDAYVDKGYRGHGYTGAAEIHIAGQRKKNTTRAERKRRRRRSAIEPKIDHLKADHRIGRCFLARLCGDAISAVLAGAGSNLRTLLGLLRRDRRRFSCALCHAAVQLAFTLIHRPRNPLAALRDHRFFHPAAA